MNLLLGVDGGNRQSDATTLAAELARVSAGRVTVATVVADRQRWARLDAERADRLRSRADEVVGQAADALRTAVPVASVGTAVIHDDSPARGLHRRAEEEGADVIVLGSCHRSAAGRVLLGSVAERVVHAAPCAVAVAPREFSPVPWVRPRIAVAYDGRPESRAALSWAATLAGERHARIRVLGVLDLATDADGLMSDALAYDLVHRAAAESTRAALEEALAALPGGTEARAEILEGPTARTLVAATRDHADLLVCGSRGYGPVGTVLMGSVSAQLLRSAHVPVVVLPRGATDTVSPIRARTAEAVAA